MAALQNKYQDLIDEAKASGVSNLEVTEQDGVLHIDGTASFDSVKDKLWATYDKIDPNYTSGDLVLNISVAPAAPGSKLKVVTESTGLYIRKGPSTEDEAISGAQHGDILTLVSQPNEQWWIVRTKNGEEGYAYAKYLELV